jgi:hypothetical protein
MGAALTSGRQEGTGGWEIAHHLDLRGNPVYQLLREFYGVTKCLLGVWPSTTEQ